MIRIITGVLAGIVLLVASIGTASAQTDTPPESSPTPTITYMPSAPPTPSSTDVTLPPSSTTSTQMTSSASSPTTASVTAVVPAAIPPVRTTGRPQAPRSTSHPVDAVAPLTTVHSAQSAAVVSSAEYSALVPWIKANEHPEWLVLALVLLFGSSACAFILYERHPRRRLRIRR